MERDEIDAIDERIARARAGRLSKADELVLSILSNESYMMRHFGRIRWD
jgi:hypothetical protein